MPLRSQFLRDDLALQKCLELDQAHVTPGASGPHVGKIQLAVTLLEKTSSIPVAELRARTYGPGTANAVLKYKQKRNLINRAYQATADNIVGKMTIASLDNELLAVEQRGSPSRVICKGPGGQPGSGDEPLVTRASLVSKPNSTAGPRQSFGKATISVVFHETDAAVNLGGGVSLLFGQFQTARKLMAPFNLDFAGGADNGVLSLVGPRIPDSEQVITGSPASTLSVRAAAERVLPGQPNVLRVIFCPFKELDPNFGITDQGDGFPKFCMINVRKANPDQGTILHEIIHAARPERVEHDKDGSSVFSENIGGRTQLPLKHAESIAHAFFASIVL